MHRECPAFGVRLDNIPIINLRWEFNAQLRLLRQRDFRELFRSPQPIQTRYFVWFGMPGEVLSLLLQRAISGLEAWITAAAWHELGVTGRLAGAGGEAVRNPGSLRGASSMVDKYYRLLPNLVYDGVALDRAEPALWERTKILYREIRNPLMHGHQITDDSADGVLECFEHIAKLYTWTDTWHDSKTWTSSPPPPPAPHILERRRLLFAQGDAEEKES